MTIHNRSLRRVADGARMRFQQPGKINLDRYPMLRATGLRRMFNDCLGMLDQFVVFVVLYLASALVSR
ncbi:MAG: hypothetical protein ACREEM_08150 [Blastocatellia bacterium]